MIDEPWISGPCAREAQKRRVIETPAEWNDLASRKAQLELGSVHSDPSRFQAEVVVAEGDSLGALVVKLLVTADQPAASSTPPIPVVVGSPVTPAAVDFSAMI